MDAVKAYAKDGAVAVMALQAGNDMVITTDYRTQIPAVIAAVQEGTLAESVIDSACLRVLKCKDDHIYIPAYIPDWNIFCKYCKLYYFKCLGTKSPPFSSILWKGRQKVRHGEKE